jgi:DNA topoisomerase VI subunit A
MTKANVNFEGNEFAIQVIGKGSYVDNGTGNGKSYRIEATTIRLNHIALNAWILSSMLNCRDCYETNEEWEAYKAETTAEREAVRAQIIDALGIKIDADKESICITQSQSEVFTVVRISDITTTG